MIAVSAASANSIWEAFSPFAAQLARDQVALGDVQLLVDRVAGELDHLHPVLEGGRDRVEDVRGGDEQHVGEVEREVEVVVAEGRFWAGSRTSSIALAGSPRKSAPILSISSIMNTGLRVPASRSARMIVPGIAPM